VRGQLVVEQAGQEAALGPGDFAITDWSRPARWATATQRAVALMFPRALLPLPHDEVARLGGVRIPGDHGAGALFSSLARQVVAHLDDYGAADGARLGTTLVDLLAAALSARLDHQGELPPGTVQQGLLRQVHGFIEQRLADPALTPGRSPPPTTSRCATCTSCSRAASAAWPAGSGSAGWSAAAATAWTRPWPTGR
jgi:AraC-binding-like domain